MRVIKKICALTLCFLLVFQVASVSAEATETPKITVENTTTYVGSEFYVDVFAENLNSLSSLDLTLFYDEDVLTLQRVDTNSLLAGAASSVNTDVSGQISLSMATTTAISGSGYILTLIFTVNPGITAQTTDIEIAIGDAYNSSFSPVSISGESGKVDILAVTEIAETFYLHSHITKSDLVLNDITKVTIFNSGFYNFASADFTFEYNPEYFELVSATLSGALLGEGAIYSCNTENLGLVKISFASTNEVYTSELFTVELKMIKDVEYSDSTEISYSCHNVATKALSVYQSYKSNATFNVLGVDGSIYIESSDFIEGLTAESTVKFSADTNVAAGDFVIRYDDFLTPVSVTANEDATTDGGMIVINPNFKNGEIKFSYVNENGLTNAVSLLDIVWNVSGSNSHTVITPYSTSLIDAEYNKISLRYAEATECIYKYNQQDVNKNEHPHQTVAECEVCKKTVLATVPALNCAQCGMGYFTATENSKIDYEKSLIIAENDFYADVKSFVNLSEKAKLTAIPSSSYNEFSFFGTGSVITVYENTTPVAEYTVVVKGDVNGDSVCDTLDCMLVELARHESNNVSLEGVYLVAGDFTEDEKIDIKDFQQIVDEATGK